MPSDTKRVVKDSVNRCCIPALSMHMAGQSLLWPRSLGQPPYQPQHTLAPMALPRHLIPPLDDEHSLRLAHPTLY
jgi:hypothetical protein